MLSDESPIACLILMSAPLRKEWQGIKYVPK